MKAPKDNIVDAALALAARQSWDSVSLGDIARESGCSLADLRMEITDKFDLLQAMHARLDQAMLAATAFEGSIKDRLFDLFMARFDAMNAHRDAYLSIFHAIKFQPKILVRSAPSVLSAMTWIIEAAGLETQGFKAEAAKAALSLVYLNALRAWVSDDSRDLSAVMARLDQGLDRVTQFI